MFYFLRLTLENSQFRKIEIKRRIYEFLSEHTELTIKFSFLYSLCLSYCLNYGYCDELSEKSIDVKRSTFSLNSGEFDGIPYKKCELHLKGVRINSILMTVFALYKCEWHPLKILQHQVLLCHNML